MAGSSTWTGTFATDGFAIMSSGDALQDLAMTLDVSATDDGVALENLVQNVFDGKEAGIKLRGGVEVDRSLPSFRDAGFKSISKLNLDIDNISELAEGGGSADSAGSSLEEQKKTPFKLGGISLIRVMGSESVLDMPCIIQDRCLPNTPLQTFSAEMLSAGSRSRARF